MRQLLIGALAIAGVAFAAPASAQGVYIGGPGVSIGVGAPVHRERHYEYDRPRHRVYRERHYDRSYARGGDCRTITIRRDDGSVRRIRRCG